MNQVGVREKERARACERQRECVHVSVCVCVQTQTHTHTKLADSPEVYGVALVSRIDKIIGLFCKRAL